jgi:hypothetical protein
MQDHPRPNSLLKKRPMTCTRSFVGGAGAAAGFADAVCAVAGEAFAFGVFLVRADFAGAALAIWGLAEAVAGGGTGAS